MAVFRGVHQGEVDVSHNVVDVWNRAADGYHNLLVNGVDGNEPWDIIEQSMDNVRSECPVCGRGQSIPGITCRPEKVSGPIFSSA
jgi:hypothetical protein